MQVRAVCVLLMFNVVKGLGFDRVRRVFYRSILPTFLKESALSQLTSKALPQFGHLLGVPLQPSLDKKVLL
jgi:hypothetical protein